MAGYGMSDPKAAAAINALAAKNNAAAAAKPYTPTVKVSPSPTAYGMNNTNAAALINNRAASNNVAATSSGGYGMSNVAAANYINSLAKTSTARSTPGTTVKNPTWSPISGMASYQLPSSFDWTSLGSFFGLDNPNTPFVNNDGSITGKYGSMAGSGFGAGRVPTADDYIDANGERVRTQVVGWEPGDPVGGMGGGGMGGLGDLASMFSGGGMGGLFGGAAGGGGGGGGGGAAPPTEKEPDKPIPQRYWAGGYTDAQLTAMEAAPDNGARALLKSQYDQENVARFKSMGSSYDDTKKERVTNAQQLAQRQGGQYDAEGNYYAADAIKSLVEEENKKRAQQDANSYDIPKGAVPVAANATDNTPAKPAATTPAPATTNPATTKPPTGKPSTGGSSKSSGGLSGLWDAFQQVADRFNGTKSKSAAQPTAATGSAGTGATGSGSGSTSDSGSGAGTSSGSGSTQSGSTSIGDDRDRKRRGAGLGMSLWGF